MHKITGRYPYQFRGPKLRPENMELSRTTLESGEMWLRITDNANPDFWLEIRIAQEPILLEVANVSL